MKIYILDFIPKINENIENLLNKQHKKVNNYKDIYSIEGIFRIQNNIVYQLIPEDVPTEKFKHNNINFILDKSKYIFRKNIYCIPYNHIVYNIQQIEYKLDYKCKISLIIEYHDNKIIDIYFYTNEENLCTNYKNNIIEYFSLLNDIKQS